MSSDISMMSSYIFRRDDERWRGTLQAYDGIYRDIYPISSYISES